MTERASDREQKEERRRQIVDAAAELFRDRDYGEITMKAVSEGAGIAKGTVYLYFDTKAELFLAVALRLMTEWFETLVAELRELDSPVSDPSVIAETMAATLSEEESLLKILQILHSTIESDVGVEAASSYKVKLGERMDTVAEELGANLEGLDREEAVRLLLWLYAFVVGLDQLAEPREPMAEAMERGDLDRFRVDFERELTVAATRWLNAIT